LQTMKENKELKKKKKPFPAEMKRGGGLGEGKKKGLHTEKGESFLW